MDSEVRVERDYAPGCIGRIAELHAIYYAREWNFGPFFEAKVAAEASAFIQRYNASRDGLWRAMVGGEMHGSVVLDAHDAEADGAHLRWFVLSDAMRGRGAGRMLLSSAIDWARACNYGRAYLWTFAGLDAARHLYESFGFVKVHEETGDQWGSVVTEQKFELQF